MQTMILALIFAGFLYSSTVALDCNTGNPCELGLYFNETNGYRCLQLGGSALCTCPGGGGAYEIDGRCRLCDRKDRNNNACRDAPGKLLQCLETRDCGTSYACLCMDSATGTTSLTLDADCVLTNTLTCPAITGPTTGSSPCLNGGVFVGTSCHCPSGYSGALCQDKSDPNLCENVRCKNKGVCAIQNTNGPYESVCLCRYGTSGEYCELNGTLGFCSSTSCMNGGGCQDKVIGSTRFAYCQCQPGYNGTKCENRYFTCTKAGKFRDADMHDQARYFECKTVSAVLRLEQRSCPKGLRFDETKQLCTY